MTKTNTRSRIVSILLVLMMLLTMVPITAVTANAADGFKEVKTYEELKAAVDKGECRVPPHLFISLYHKTIDSVNIKM